MLSIRVLLREEDIADEFLASIVNRHLDEKFFYWFPASVRAWLNLCRDGAYRNFLRSHTLLQQHAAELATHLPSGPIEVVSLGAGQGVKDFLVLERLRESGHTPLYVPVDVSQYLLEMTCYTAEQQGYACHGIKADLTNPDHLTACHKASQSKPRLVMILGNTLGAFDPFGYTEQLAALLRPQDYLLADGELFSAAGTMAGYDNPVNRQFAFAPLRSIGLKEPDDGTLNFEMAEDTGATGLYRLSKHFQIARPLKRLIAGENVELRQGERIEMNWSSKYAEDTFLAVFRQAGVELVAQYLSDDERFLMVLGCPR